MAGENSLSRLLLLQRDLIAFSEYRLPRLDRLRFQLDASAEDLKKLLDRKKKNEASRAILSPSTNPPPKTLKVDDVEYTVRPEFRQYALQVADELDLDELDAAKLCIEAQPVENRSEDTTQVFRALLRFHEQRRALLDCLRRLLQLGTDFDSDDERTDGFRDVVRLLIRGDGGSQTESSAYWRKCLDGLLDVEIYLKKLNDHKQMILMTGQTPSDAADEALYAERLLLTEQHESLASILSYMIRGNFVQPEDYRAFLSRAAALEAENDITIHYLPILISGAAYFGSDHTVSLDTATDLHKLFATGPGQLQWKQTNLKAAATACWLAEYNSRFAPHASQSDESDEEEARSKLFFNALQNKAFHYMLSSVAFLRPAVWYDPSRAAITQFLVDSVGQVSPNAPRASEDFSVFAMRELQVFTDAFITNMPDILRKLKLDEDEKRRNGLPQDLGNAHQAELGLERFIVIMAFAYDGDADAARDFWADRESNLYGFLRWASQRLPTPRVAAFCQLLRSIACDAYSANQAHRFLLEDVAMTSGKLRKAHAVSWAQIFTELELYAASLSAKEKDQSKEIDEPETGIMLDSYLGLAAHICRTSPDARNWLLRDQSFHLGDVMFKLAHSETLARVQACCLDVLSALLVDNVLEVRNGMWVLLDGWGSDSTVEAPNALRPPASKQLDPAKQYLHLFANNAEVGASLVGLLNALVTPSSGRTEPLLDELPFPENLGAPVRLAGIDTYVDFVLDTIFARRIPRMILEGEDSLVDLMRFNCLQFAYICLSTFNEDLVLLANTTNIPIESAMETKSLASYIRLHPFARVMEWLFNGNVMESLFATLQRRLEILNEAPQGSPLVQSTLKSIQALNVAWKLQPTYFDVVRPITNAETSHAPLVVGSSCNSVDEMILSHLEAVVDIANGTTSSHTEISLECIALLERISASRKISMEPDLGGNRARHGSRIAGLLAGVAPTLTTNLHQDFLIESWDLETSGIPLKIIKCLAVVDLLNASLTASNERPGIAHCLLGFDCSEGAVRILPDSPFSEGRSLFDGVVKCAAQLPGAIDGSNMSWLLSTKRGCLEVISKLVNSSLTASLIQTELRRIDFQPAFAYTQAPASLVPLWEGKDLQDSTFLLDESALALRDFMYVRAAYFDLSAADLRSAAELRLYSVQEKIVSTLLGKATNGDQPPAASMLELFDFFELETCPAFEANCTYFTDIDISGCTKEDDDSLTLYDVKMAEELLILRKRELTENGTIKENSEQQVDDEIGAIIASLTSLNNWTALQSARLTALEAWTDLMSLIVTSGGLQRKEVVTLSLQGLLVVVPKLERALFENLDAAALLAKLTLTLTTAISPASHDESQQTANVAIERLLATYRVSLKAITDSNTDSAIRDVCYRMCCAVLGAFPQDASKGQSASSASVKQLATLVQNAGERLLTVVTEDAFSGRGVTRVSALLFLDGLLALFQKHKGSAFLLRALTKLNFVPVLIDSSIGNIAAAFQGEDESVTTLAYFHSAFALLLRFCQVPDGAQLVLNSNFFDTVVDSKLFSTDPDIGLDIDNAASLKEFYRILAAILRVITAITVIKGPQHGLPFLQQNRWSMTAVFKRSSTDKASEVRDVAAEFSRLIMATGFLEDDEPVHAARMNGFT